MAELSKEVQYIKGVGPNRVKLLNNLNIFTLKDLITYYPRDYEDRSKPVKIEDLVDGEEALIAAQIDVEDYEENHPETEGNTEANNTVGSNKVENPHTGDSILVYAVAGIIAIIGIATLTKKK